MLVQALALAFVREVQEAKQSLIQKTWNER
jgi:hypothetical protein